MISNNFTKATTNLDQNFIESPTTFNDSIASLCWTPLPENKSLLACSSWDSQVVVYSGFEEYLNEDVDDLSEIIIETAENPYLCTGWVGGPTDSNPALLLGGIDGTVCSRSLNSNRTVILGKHDDAVKGIYRYSSESHDQVWSVSYDKVIKVWDFRNPEPIMNFNLPAKPVCIDVLDDTVAIGLNNEKLLIFDIKDINQVFQNVERYYVNSPLGSGSQLSSISISKENVIGVGAYDGRSNLSTFSRKSDGTSEIENIVTFKAHKIDPGQDGNSTDLKILYPIHAVGLHPTNRKTYFTAGGDGDIIFWDLVSKNKLTTLSCRPMPVTAAKMSPDGSFLAYGVGYDWSKGIEGHQSFNSRLHFHEMQPNDVVPL